MKNLILQLYVKNVKRNTRGGRKKNHVSMVGLKLKINLSVITVKVVAFKGW